MTATRLPEARSSGGSQQSAQSSSRPIRIVIEHCSQLPTSYKRHSHHYRPRPEECSAAATCILVLGASPQSARSCSPSSPTKTERCSQLPTSYKRSLVITTARGLRSVSAAATCILGASPQSARSYSPPTRTECCSQLPTSYTRHSHYYRLRPEECFCCSCIHREPAECPELLSAY